MRQVIIDKGPRERFINAVISLLKRSAYDLSGIDIDWENNFDLPPLEMKRFPVFLHRLRDGLRWNGLSRDLLSVDLPAPGKFAKLYPNPRKWLSYVNWANLMAYEYYGNEIPYAELDATLGKVTGSYSNITPSYATTSLINTLNIYRKRGISNNKLIITLPFYASANYIYHADKAHNYGLRQITITPRIYTYPYWVIYTHYGIIGDKRSPAATFHKYTFNTPAAAAGKHSFWITYKRPISVLSPSLKRYLFISYPDPISTREIAQYAIKHGYHGLSVWTLTDDVHYYNKHSLLKVLYRSIHS